jgi:zinc protease
MSASAARDLVVEADSSLPLVHFSVSLRTGAALDPLGADGSSRLLTRLMRRTAGGRSAEQNDILVDGLGAACSADVGSSSLGFSGMVITRSLPKMLELLAEILSKPELPEAELQLLKRETLAELEQLKESDKVLARRWFARRFFAGHSYGRPSAGTPTTLASIDRAALRQGYQRSFTADNLVCCFAGDLDNSTAEAARKTLKSALPPGGVPVDTTGDPQGVNGRRLVIVDKPERTQTQIVIGCLGTHTSDADHVALHVANTVLGGTFTARLMQEIRVKRGWSYGANSSLAHERRRHAMTMSAFPKAEDCAPCIALQLQLLEAWHDTGITQAELDSVKSYLTRSHAFNIDTCSKRASLSLDEILYDLPAGYYKDYLARINAVTVEQANAAIQKRIHPENLLIVVVGTESVIGGPVREAIPNLADSEIIPYDTD